MTTSYYVPDLTGQNSNYYVYGDIYTIFKTNQVIEFPHVIYLNSLSLTTTDVNQTQLTYGVDYTANPTDLADTEMSRARNAMPSFSSTLVKSITIIRPSVTANIQVSASYQQFYATSPDSAISEGAGIVDLTPSLISDMLRRLSAVEQLSSGVVNPAVPSSATPALLAFDPNEELAANVISNEPHVINTLQRVNIIRPVQGSFFDGSLVLTAGTYTLVEGTDYQPVSLNRALTISTQSTSGVYDLILVTYAYAGTVNVTYHAVGGDVSVNDLSQVYTLVQGIVTYLNTSGFVTGDALWDLPAYKSLVSQIQTLGADMRSLLSGQPTYGGTTTGTTIVKQLRAVDTKMHWWTIGSLYTVASVGTPQISTADRMSLHVEMVNAHYQADIDVAVDINNVNNPVTITARNVIYDPGFNLDSGTVSALIPMAPQMRVIWNPTVNNVSGALLQIGLSLEGLTDTIAVEDRSGVESTWILNTTTGTTSSPLLPSDNAITLPDGASIWNNGVAGSTSVSQTLQNNSGFLVSGSFINFNAFDFNSQTRSSNLVINLPSTFNILDLKKIRIMTTSNVSNASNINYDMNVFTSSSSGTITATGTTPVLINSSTGAVGSLSINLSTSGSGFTGTINLLGLSSISDGYAVTNIIGYV